jgi:hypothetical protein
MARITGRVEVLVNSQLLLNKSGATASGIGLSGEPNYELAEVMGDTGLHGFTETPILAQLEVTITDRDDSSLDALARVRENGTVIFRSANGGKVYTMNNATCKRNLSITAGEGETTITFIGPNWVESTEQTT